MSAVVDFLSSVVISALFNFISGLIFALQFLSFVVFCVYLANEISLLIKGKNAAEWMKTTLFALLVKYGIFVIVQEDRKEFDSSKHSQKVNL